MSMMNQIMYCLRKQPQVTTTDNFMNYCYMDYEKHFIKVLCSHKNMKQATKAKFSDIT